MIFIKQFATIFKESLKHNLTLPSCVFPIFTSIIWTRPHLVIQVFFGDNNSWIILIVYIQLLLDRY